MKIALVITLIAALHTTAAAEPTAEDHFNKGQEAYDRGDYSVAIGEWQESFRLSGENALLFNLAQAYRLHGDCENALATYRRFVAADPGSEQKHLAEDLSHELGAKCGEKPKAPEPPEPPLEHPKSDGRLSVAEGLLLVQELRERKSPPSQSGRTLKIAGLATAGTGTVIVVTGLILGHHGQTIGNEVTSTCANGCDWSTQKDKDAAGRRDVTIGHVLDGVGAAAILSGAAMYYFGYRESTITVEPTTARDRGAVVMWSGSW